MVSRYLCRYQTRWDWEGDKEQISDHFIQPCLKDIVRSNNLKKSQDGRSSSH